MNLAEMLASVRSYDHRASRSQPAQQHLQQVRRGPPATFPPGMMVRVSGSGRSLPLVAWVALLNPDVTTTAQDGLYLVYLFDVGAASVYLSMNQGVTQYLPEDRRATATRADERAAIEQIRLDTAAIRSALGPTVPARADTRMSLGSDQFLGLAYEAGNIGAVRYDLDALPSDAELATDLDDFNVLYAGCVEAWGELRADRKVMASARSAKVREQRLPHAAGAVFRPKSSDDYFVSLPATLQRRSRLHEALLAEFGKLAQAAGGIVATNVHPRDLTIDRDGQHWLIEAKTVGPNAEHAVRDAIGQLFTYRYFCYPGGPPPKLLGLFSGPIGDAFGSLLSSLGIEHLCREAGAWTGSADALALLS